MSNSESKDALDRTSEIESTVKVRKSGQGISGISIPVWFVHENNTLYLLPVQGSETNWYKNMLNNSTIKISINGTQITKNEANK
jgi:hypothetical protein